VDDWLVRAPAPLRADELRSTLRQVYAALVITATAVAALGGMAALLYAVLLAGFGDATWHSVLVNQTPALATVIVAAPLWAYHRRQLANEVRMSAQAARVATAQHVIGYLMAAIGLTALFFGLGELLSTLLRSVLAPDVFGRPGANRSVAAWRSPWWRCWSTASRPRPWSGARMRHRLPIFLTIDTLYAPGHTCTSRI